MGSGKKKGRKKHARKPPDHQQRAQISATPQFGEQLRIKRDESGEGFTDKVLKLHSGDVVIFLEVKRKHLETTAASPIDKIKKKKWFKVRTESGRVGYVQPSNCRPVGSTGVAGSLSPSEDDEDEFESAEENAVGADSLAENRAGRGDVPPGGTSRSGAHADMSAAQAVGASASTQNEATFSIQGGANGLQGMSVTERPVPSVDGVEEGFVAFSLPREYASAVQNGALVGSTAHVQNGALAANMRGPSHAFHTTTQPPAAVSTTSLGLSSQSWIADSFLPWVGTQTPNSNIPFDEGHFSNCEEDDSTRQDSRGYTSLPPYLSEDQNEEPRSFLGRIFSSGQSRLAEHVEKHLMSMEYLNRAFLEALYKTFITHNVGFSLDDGEKICGVLLRFIKHTESDNCLLVVMCVLSFMMEKSRSEGFSVDNLVELYHNKDFQGFVRQLNEKAQHLPPSFPDDMLGQVMEDGMTKEEMIRNYCVHSLLAVIHFLSRVCDKDSVYLLIALIVLDCRMNLMHGSVTRSWDKYLRHLQWQQDSPEMFLEVVAKREHWFPIAFNDVAYNLVLRRLYPERARISVNTVRSLYKSGQALRIAGSELVRLLSVLLPEDHHQEALITLMSVAGPDMDQDCMNGLMFTLSQCRGRGRSLQSHLAQFRERVGKLIQAIEKEQPRGKRGKAMKIVRHAFVSVCIQLPAMTSSVAEIAEGVSDTSAGHRCLVELAIAYLIGAADKDSISRLTDSMIAETASLVDALHNAGHVDLVNSHLPEILVRLSIRVHGNPRSIAMFIQCSHYLCTSSDPLTMVDKARIMQCFSNFPAYGSLEKLLTEAAEIIKLLSQQDQAAVSYTLVGCFWKAFVIHASSSYAMLSNTSQEDGETNLDILTRFPQRLEKEGASNPILEAVLYTFLLKVVKGFSPHNALWSVTNPRVVHLLHCCHVAYSQQEGPRETTDCLGEMPAMFQQMCDDLAHLAEKLNQRQYTEEEYEVYKPHEVTINKFLVGIGLSRVTPLTSLSNLFSCCPKMLSLLNWLQERSVPGAGEASTHVQRVIRARNDVTYAELEELLFKYEGAFEEPLRQQVVSGHAATVVDYIHHFVCEKPSALFQQSTTSDEGVQWHRSILKSVKNVHSFFSHLLEGKLTYSVLQVLDFYELSESAITGEIDTILAFPVYSYVQQREGGAQIAQKIKGVLRNIQRIQSGHLQALVEVACEMFSIVNENDSDVQYLRELCRNEIESSTLLLDLQTTFVQLDTLLADIPDNTLPVFSSVHKNRRIVEYFHENDCHSEHGQEQYQKKVEFLTISLQHDVEGSRLLDAFLFAHQTMLPFCKHHHTRALISLRHLLKVVAETPFNENALITANDHVHYINELLRSAIGGSSEKAADQLVGLVESGYVYIHLKAMSCQVTTYTYEYTPRTTILSLPADNTNKRITMSKEEVGYFRGSLQYLCSLQENEKERENTADIGARAEMFQQLQEHVDKLVQVSTELELTGHPVYQDCILKYRLTDSEITCGLETLQRVANCWKCQLVEVRKCCNLLQLFTDQDVAVMLMLLNNSDQLDESIAEDDEGTCPSAVQDGVLSTGEMIANNSGVGNISSTSLSSISIASFGVMQMEELSEPADSVDQAGSASSELESTTQVPQLESSHAMTAAHSRVRGNTIRRRHRRQAAVAKLTDVGEISSQCDVNDEDSKQAAHLLARYLQSVSRVTKMKETVDLDKVVKQYMANSFNNSVDLLQHLKALFNEVFSQQSFASSRSGKQFVSVVGTEGNSCTDSLLLLGNIFASQSSLPCHAQILFCSEKTTVEGLQAFFWRIKTFPQLPFVLVGVDRLPFSCRTFVWKQQQELMELEGCHGDVFYICLQSSASTTWSHMYVQSFQPADNYRSLVQRTREKLESSRGGEMPTVVTVIGEAGDGKSHYIQKKLREMRDNRGGHHCQEHPLGDERKTAEVNHSSSVISINDASDTASILRKLSFVVEKDAIFFNISSHAHLPDVNRIFFELLFCSALRDPLYGSLLYVPPDYLAKSTWYIEVPSKRTLSEILSADHLLPVLAMVPTYPKAVEKISQETYELQISACEKLVAQLVKLFQNPPRDFALAVSRAADGRLSLKEKYTTVHTDVECKELVTAFLEKEGIRPHRIHQVSFLQFLKNRLELFRSSLYLDVCTYTFGPEEEFAIRLFRQFVSEAKYLCTRELKCTWRDCNQFFVIRDAGDGSCLLPWQPFLPSGPDQGMLSLLSPGLDALEESSNPMVKFLQWVFALKEGRVEELLKMKQFVLTKDFTYKLLMIHERRRARQSLIIEGETGVGKTYLLDMYTLLLNEQAATSHQLNYSPRLKYRFSDWLVHLVRGSLWDGLTTDNKRWLATYSKLLSAEGEAVRESAMDDLKADDCDELVKLWQDFVKQLDEDCQREAITELKRCVCRWYDEYKLLKPLDALWKAKLEEQLAPNESAGLLHAVLGVGVHSLFYPHLVHPGTTKQRVKQFLQPVIELAVKVPMLEVVVFFDEVNTANCLGFFKELLMDRMMDGTELPENIFFISAINPSAQKKSDDQDNDVSQNITFQSVYHVHELPSVMNELMWKYGSLHIDELNEYISQKIEMQGFVETTDERQITFSPAIKKLFSEFLLASHKFFVVRHGESAVSQREIQRVFKLVPFFWRLEEYYRMNEPSHSFFSQEPINDNERFTICICLAVAVVYYFRLPHGLRSGAQSDNTDPWRQDFEQWISRSSTFSDGSDIYGFVQNVNDALDKFVTDDHFMLPGGVALTRALKENIFCTVACIESSLPFGIVGLPGSSKTLSYHIVRENLRGQHSPRPFCSQFVAVDSFFYQCSEQSSAIEIAAVFERAIERQQRYNEQAADLPEPMGGIAAPGRGQRQAQRGKRTRCVVFLDEAGLPKKELMELKVLHPYLDDCKVAFVALSNHAFDAANANRMVILCRSQADADDLEVLARGCVGLKKKRIAENPQDFYIKGICRGFLQVTQEKRFEKMFHHRDLIYMFRHLHRCDLMKNNSGIQPDPHILLEALEENFNGVEETDFKDLVDIFFAAVHRSLKQKFSHLRFPKSLESSKCRLRSTLQILQNHRQQLSDESLHLYEESLDFRTRLSLVPRFRMIIDETNDGSTAVDLLFQLGLLEQRASHVFHMSDLPDDTKELHSAEILARLRRYLERPETIVLVNTERIHGSLYELLNQTFSIISSSNGEPQIFTKIAVGATTYACRVHPQFHCVIVLKKQQLAKAPTPFLSRFSKFLLTPCTLLQSMLTKLESSYQRLLQQILTTAESFIKHMGLRNFHGYTRCSLSCLLLSHLEQTRASKDDFCFMKEANRTTEAICQQYTVSMGDEGQLLVRALCGRLLQLMPPEFFVLKLPTLADTEAYHNIYFNTLEHFSLEKIFTDAVRHAGSHSPKTMLYVRSSGAIAAMMSKPQGFFSEEASDVGESLVWIDTMQYTCSADVERQLSSFVKSTEKKCCAVLLDTTQWGSVSDAQSHAAHYRYLIDSAHAQVEELACGRDKVFFFIIQLSRHQAYTRHPCPAAFLRGWDSLFVDSPSNSPIVDIKCLAQSCTVVRSQMRQVSHQEEMKTSLEYSIAHLKDELAQFFCSRLNQVVVQPSLVATLHPQLQPLYKSGQSPIERAKAISFMLEKDGEETCCIIQYIAQQLCHELCGEQSVSILNDLAEEVATKDIFFGFSDMVDMYLRPRLHAVFNKTVLALANDFGLASLNQTQLSRHDMLKLLRLIPKPNVSELQGQARQYLSCGQQRPQTPLFRLLKSRTDQLVTKVPMGQPHAIRQLELLIAEDDVLHDLSSSTDIMTMYRSDVIREMCETSDQKISHLALDIAAEWVRLHCLEADDVNQLALIHMVMHSFKKELLLLVCGSEALLTLSKNLIGPVTEFRKETNHEEYLRLFAEHLFVSLWRYLSSLQTDPAHAEDDGERIEIAEQDVSECIQKWMRSYRFITEFWSMETREESVSRPLYVPYTERVHLMKIAYAFFSCYELMQDLSTRKCFLQVMWSLHHEHAGRLSSKTVITYTMAKLCTALTGQTERLLPFLIELLSLEIANQHKPLVNNERGAIYRQSVDIDFLVHVFGTGSVPDAVLTLSYEACEQLFLQLADHLQPSTGQPADVKKWHDYIEHVVIKFFSTQGVVTSAPTSSYHWSKMYIPRDLHADVPAESQAVQDFHVSHIFFTFTVQELKRSQQSLAKMLSLASGQNTTLRSTSNPSVQFVKTIKVAGCVRAVLDGIVEFVADSLDKASARVSEEILSELDKVATALFEESNWPHNHLYFLSELIARKGTDLVARFVNNLNQSWAKDMQENVAEIEGARLEDLLSFLPNACQANSRLAELRQPYQCFSELFEKSRTENNNFRSLREFCQRKLSDTPQDNTLPPKREVVLFLLLKIYRDYFVPDKMAELNGLKAVLDMVCLEPIQQQALCLLLEPPQGLSKSMMEIFTPGKCRTEVQHARDILIVTLACVLSMGEENNHYYTLLAKPTDLLRTYLFGGVNWRSRIDPRPNEVKIDCCFQFEYNGDPTYISFFPMILMNLKMVSLNLTGAHLNALISFACLCLHGLLFSNEASENLDQVMSIDDVKAEVPDESLPLLERISEFLFTRLVTLHYHLQNDRALSAAGTLHFIFTYLELFVKLHAGGGAGVLSSTYVNPDDRQLAEEFVQMLIEQAFLDVARQQQQQHSDRQPLLGKYVHQSKPSLSLKALQQSLAEKQPDGQVASRPILTAMLHQHKQLSCLPLALPIADLYLWIHNWLAGIYSEEDILNISIKEAVDTFAECALESEDPGLRIRADKAQKMLNHGRESLNEFHRCNGGLLQPGACGEQHPFMRLENESMLSYVVSASQDDSDVLFKVVQAILRYQDDFLSVCQSSRDNADTPPALRYLLDGCQLEQPVSMLNVLSSPQGSGLLHITEEVLEQLAQTYGWHLQDSNGVWHAKFDLATIERLLVQRFVSKAWPVMWAPLWRLFMFKPIQKEASVLSNLASLNAALPGKFKTEKLSDDLQQKVSQNLKQLSSQDIIHLLRNLALLSDMICEKIQTPGSNWTTDRLLAASIGDFLSQQGLTGNILVQLCQNSDLQLRHTGVLYDLCEEHLHLHDYLFQGLPNLLRQNLDAQVAEQVTVRFDAELDKAGEDPGLMVQAGEDAVNILQGAVPYLQQQLDESLSSLLKTFQLIDNDDLLALLPCEVCCCHLKSVLVLLLKFIQRARAKQIHQDTAVNTLERWSEASTLQSSPGESDARNQPTGGDQPIHEHSDEEFVYISYSDGSGDETTDSSEDFSDDDDDDDLSPGLWRNRYSRVSNGPDPELDVSSSQDLSQGCEDIAVGSVTTKRLPIRKSTPAPHLVLLTEGAAPKISRHISFKDQTVTLNANLKQLSKHLPGKLHLGDVQWQLTDCLGYVLGSDEDVGVIGTDRAQMFVALAKDVITLNVHAYKHVGMERKLIGEQVACFAGFAKVGEVLQAVLRLFKEEQPTKAALHLANGAVLDHNTTLKTIAGSTQNIPLYLAISDPIVVECSNYNNVTATNTTVLLSNIKRNLVPTGGDVSVTVWPPVEVIVKSTETTQRVLLIPSDNMHSFIIHFQKKVWHLQLSGLLTVGTVSQAARKHFQIGPYHSVLCTLMPDGKLLSLPESVQLRHLFSSPSQRPHQLVLRVLFSTSHELLVSVNLPHTISEQQICAINVDRGTVDTSQVLHKVAAQCNIDTSDTVLVDNSTQCKMLNRSSLLNYAQRQQPALSLCQADTLHSVEVCIGDHTGPSLHHQTHCFTSQATASQLLHHILNEPSTRTVVSQLTVATQLLTLDGFVLDNFCPLSSFSSLFVCPALTSQHCHFVVKFGQRPHQTARLTSTSNNTPSACLVKHVAYLTNTPLQQLQLSIGGIDVTKDSGEKIKALKEHFAKETTAETAEIGTRENPLECLIYGAEEEDSKMVEVEVEDVNGQRITLSLAPTATIHQIFTSAEQALNTSCGLSLVVNGTHQEFDVNDDKTTVQDLLQADGSLCVSFALATITVQRGSDEGSQEHLQVSKNSTLPEIWRLIVRKLSPEAEAEIELSTLQIGDEEQLFDEEDGQTLSALMEMYGRNAVFSLHIN